MIGLVGMRRYRSMLVLVGSLLCLTAQAQQVPASPAVGAPVPPEAAGPIDQAAQPLAEAGNVTTLGEVRAIKPEDDEPLDLYRFKNPVKAAPNRFSKNWSEPPTPEQVGMSGGYVMMGIVYGITKAAQGLNKLTGGPDQIQSAIARPPPELTEQEQQRAAEYCAVNGCTVPER